MNKYFQLIVMLFSFLTINAQMVIITNDTISVTSDNLNNSYTVKSYLINNSAFDLDVSWNISDISTISSEWTASFCFTPLDTVSVGGACIDLLFLSTGSKVTGLSPGDSVEIKISTGANGMPDSTYLDLYLGIKENGNPANFTNDTVLIKIEFEGQIIDNITNENFQNINIYPNPVKNSLNIISDDNIDIDKIEIFNIIGKKVYEMQTKSMNNTLELAKLNKGVYLIKLFSKDETAFHTQTFIKN